MKILLCAVIVSTVTLSGCQTMSNSYKNWSSGVTESFIDGKVKDAGYTVSETDSNIAYKADKFTGRIFYRSTRGITYAYDGNVALGNINYTPMEIYYNGKELRLVIDYVAKEWIFYDTFIAINDRGDRFVLSGIKHSDKNADNNIVTDIMPGTVIGLSEYKKNHAIVRERYDSNLSESQVEQLKKLFSGNVVEYSYRGNGKRIDGRADLQVNYGGGSGMLGNRHVLNTTVFD